MSRHTVNLPALWIVVSLVLFVALGRAVAGEISVSCPVGSTCAFTLAVIPATDPDLTVQAGEGLSSAIVNGDPEQTVEINAGVATEIPRQWLLIGENTVAFDAVVSALMLSWADAAIPPIGAGASPCWIMAKPATGYYTRIVQSCDNAGFPIAAAAHLSPAQRQAVLDFAQALQSGTVGKRQWPLVFSAAADPTELDRTCGGGCH